MIEARIDAEALESNDIKRLLDDAQCCVISAAVGTDGTEFTFGDMKTPGTAFEARELLETFGEVL